MCETPEFKLWVKKMCGSEDAINAQVEREMWPVNIKTEVREGDKWVEPELPLT